MRYQELERKISRGLEVLDTNKALCGKQRSSSESIFKGIQPAERAKAEGNKLYGTLSNHGTLTMYYKILHLYNESIAYAPVESELLATAYSNKSALLKHMRKYTECITEIDKSFRITMSIPLKVKLLCRKSECLTALGSCENRQYLEKARFFLTRSVIEDEKTKELLKSLITKTQQVIDENKLDTPSRNKRKIEASREVAEVEKRDIWSSVRVGLSEKYGRHLIAKRDFEPGEIIYIEKPYCCYLDGSRIYQYCCHCLNYLWTIVPCDHCPWRSFCSEECKKQAWNQYHELECSAVCHARTIGVPFGSKNFVVPFLVCIFFKALREAGSISHMQAELKSLDKSENRCNNSSSLDEKQFSSYKTLYSLSNCTRKQMEALISSNMECGLTMSAIVALAVIAKYTKVFGKVYDFDNIKILRKNNVALFVGAFLLRISLKIPDYSISPYLLDPSDPPKSIRERSIEDLFKPTKLDENSFAGVNLVLTTYLTIVGCVPNVNRLLTFGNKFILYALQPIKAGTQLTCGNDSSTIFDYVSKSARQSIHQKLYNCPCDCQACVGNWSEMLNPFAKLGITEIPTAINELTDKWASELKSLQVQWKENGHKQNYLDTRQISKIKSVVGNVWNLIPMPSLTILHAVDMLRLGMMVFYNPSEIAAKFMSVAVTELP